MKLGVDLYGICLDKFGSGGIVALALDALHFGKELTDEFAHLGVVVDFDIGLAVALHEFDYVVGLTFLKHPFGDELTVAHMGLLDVFARFNSGELGHETVEDILVIFGLVGFGVIEQTEFDEFGIGQIIEREKVGAGFLESGAVSFERARVNTGEQTARCVAETFVQVGVEVVGDEEIFVHEVGGLLIDDKLFVESVAVRSLVVGFGDVFERNGLRAVGGAYPVGVGEIDADGGGGICVTGQDGCGDYLGTHTLYLVFAETGVDGRVALKPCGVVGYDLGAVAGLVVFEVDDRLIGSGHAEGVAVVLDETVDKVDAALGVLGPCDRVGVEVLEVARAEVGDEFGHDVLLGVVFGIGESLLEIFDDALKSGRVESAHLIYLFGYLAVLFDHAGVQSPRHGGEVGGVLESVVIGLDFGLVYAVIEIVG